MKFPSIRHLRREVALRDDAHLLPREEPRAWLSHPGALGIFCVFLIRSEVISLDL